MADEFNDQDLIEIPGANGQPIKVAASALSPETLAKIQPPAPAPVVTPDPYKAAISQAQTSVADDKKSGAQDKLDGLAERESLYQEQMQRDAKGGISEAGLKEKWAPKLDALKAEREQLNLVAPSDAPAPGQLTGAQSLQGPEGSSALPPGVSPAPAKPPVPTGADFVAKGFSQERLGIDQAAKVAETRGRRDASYIAGAQDQMAQVEAQRQKLQVQRQQQFDQYKGELAKNQQEYAAATPKDYWADRSTGAKMGAAIAIAFGAYGAAKTGGPNQALQIINDAVDRDAKMQAAKRDMIREKGSQIRNTYQDYLKEYGDSESALMATKAQGLEMAKLKLEQSASMSQAEGAQAIKNQMTGALTAKQGEYLNALAAKKIEIDSKKAELSVPGLGQFATTKEGAAKLNQLVADTTTAKDGIRHLLGFVGKPGATISPEERAEAQTTANMLKGSLRTLLVGPGAVSESERKIIESVVRDPTTLMSLSSANKRALETLTNRLDANLAHNAKAFGLTNTQTEVPSSQFKRNK